MKKEIQKDLTTGKITSKMWAFAIPLMLGNVMQQLYNLVDTWIVGKYIGADALAAVGASYTLMTFLTSIILGLCLGSSAFFGISFGKRDFAGIRNGIFISFSLIGGISAILFSAVMIWIRPIIRMLQVPVNLQEIMHTYLFFVCTGIMGVFLYNFYANLLRGIGNSLITLIFLGTSVLLNILLDVVFVAKLGMGIKGAAIATVISQYLAGIGAMLYFYFAYKELRLRRKDFIWNRNVVRKIVELSGITCVQQAVMNFGILMVQGLVNSFGASVMSAFAVAVKIDTIAYMPVQDYGNAFSTFIAQNYGAGKEKRIRKGMKSSFVQVVLFCVCISTVVFILAEPLMKFFVSKENVEVVSIGVNYLRIEGAFYFGIGILFMLYGIFRGVNRPGISLILTVISLGTRVILAYVISGIPWIGVTGIWVAIPIGWMLADGYGLWKMRSIVTKGEIA